MVRDARRLLSIAFVIHLIFPQGFFFVRLLCPIRFISLILTHCVFLQAAGNAVKRASDNLVKAAQKAAFDAQDDQAVVVKSKMVGGIAQVRQRSQQKRKYKHRRCASLLLQEDVTLIYQQFSSIY